MHLFSPQKDIALIFYHASLLLIRGTSDTDVYLIFKVML